MRTPLPLAILAPLTLACVPDAPADACYLDGHCAIGLSCVEGQCAIADAGTSTGDDAGLPGDLKLDVGGGHAEIPTTCAAALSVRTNAGCEFWAVDLPNAWLSSSPFGLDIAADQQFAVVVANVSDTEDAEVQVFLRDDTEPLRNVTVAPRSARTIELPARSTDPTTNGTGVAFRIVSDVPITAYQFQPLDNLVPVYSNDASALLPAHVLEDDYIAVTSDALTLTMYPPNSHAPGSYGAGAFVTAVATVDDTRVVFYPTAALAPGDIESVVLDRGETFTILSAPGGETGDPWGNLSGTRVIADHPLALFSGNVVGSEPRGGTECCADHVEHQMLPLVAWGSSYVAVPPPLPADSTRDAPAAYRITAAFDGTVLEYAGTPPPDAPTSLDANQTAVFVTTDALLVRSDSAHPFAVTQFLLSGGENPGGGEDGDPAMIAQPSVSQLQSRYVFLTPNGYRESVVSVYAADGATVELDGRRISQWRALGDQGGVSWVSARVRLEPGVHVLVADAPTGIDVYGYDRNVSYAYAGGSAVERISEAPPTP